MMEKKSKKRNEFFYFAFKNNKLRIGLLIVLFFLVMAIIGPSFTENDPLSFIHRGVPLKPFESEDFIFGTTVFGQDVYSQFVYGLRATFVVGAIGGGLATLIGVIVGFIGGYMGGKTDEGLNMGTNIVLVIPTLAVLLIISAYLEVRGIHGMALDGQGSPGADIFITLARIRGFGQDERYEILEDHFQGNRSKHDVLSAACVHSPIRRCDAQCSDAGLHRAGSHTGDFTGTDDEPRRGAQRAAARYLVVVHSSGAGDHGDRWCALRHECGIG